MLALPVMEAVFTSGSADGLLLSVVAALAIESESSGDANSVLSATSVGFDRFFLASQPNPKTAPSSSNLPKPRQASRQKMSRGESNWFSCLNLRYFRRGGLAQRHRTSLSITVKRLDCLLV